MAVARYHDLRRQIDSLVAENEELKQLVQLLRENHELKHVLRSQFHESTLPLPDCQAPRIDAEVSCCLPAFPESSGRPSSSARPQATLWLNIQGRPLPDLAIQGAQHPPPPPPPPPDRGGSAAPGPVPTLRMALQQDKQYPFRYRAISPPSSPAHLALSANSPASSCLSNGSFQSSTLRGYCFECPFPWHPHVPPFSPTTTSSDPNFSSPLESGTFSSFDWSLANGQNLPHGPAVLEQSAQAPAGYAQPLVASGPPSAMVFDFNPRHASSPAPVPAPFPAAPDNMAVTAVAAAAAPASSWDNMTFLFPNVAPGAPPPTSLCTVPQVPPHLQPIILRNPDPFVLQPPPPGRSARAPLLPAPLPLPFPAPPVGLQRPPDVRPKERRGSAKPLDAVAVMKINEAKMKDTSRQERVLGEIAFQLDRRILALIFPNRNRLYGYTVQNVPEKVAKGGNDPFQRLSPEESAAILERYEKVMERLKPLGFDPNVHPRQMETVVNNFGILRERPEDREEEFNDVRYLRNLIKDTAPPDLRNTCILLLSCLHQLSQEDGKPLFVW